jgi:hypothetical protein
MPSEVSKGQGGANRKANQSGPQANIAAAKANKATAVRPFAVGNKQLAPPVTGAKPPAKAITKQQQQLQQQASGKWAGGAFLNSPPPSSLPMPKFVGAVGSTSVSVALHDPAIISSSGASGSVQRGGGDATPQSARKGSRVLAKFTDGLWYVAYLNDFRSNITFSTPPKNKFTTRN